MILGFGGDCETRPLKDISFQQKLLKRPFVLYVSASLHWGGCILYIVSNDFISTLLLLIVSLGFLPVNLVISLFNAEITASNILTHSVYILLDESFSYSIHSVSFMYCICLLPLFSCFLPLSPSFLPLF